MTEHSEGRQGEKMEEKKLKKGQGNSVTWHSVVLKVRAAN